MKLKHLFLSITIYTALFFLMFPGYRYVIDPDATGYLAVAERLAAGDSFNAINGLWSPLGSWLLVPFIKVGLDGVITVKFLNGLYGLISLCAFYFLIKKLKISFSVAIGLVSSSIFLILYFVFLRLFGDLLQAMFLLLYLNVICGRGFYSNYKAIILAAFLGGIGFYAKAFSFYFTISHLVLLLLILEKKAQGRYLSVGGIKKIVLAIVTLVIMVLPWAIALHNKYGGFMLSRTGAFNMTWSLSKAFVQPRVVFFPPPYTDGYSIWEDLSYWPYTNITPFTNIKLFIFQVKLIFANALEIVSVLNNFTFFLIAIIITGVFLYFSKARLFFEHLNNAVLLSFILVWPLGFLLLHVEARFFWIEVMAALLLSGVLLTYIHEKGLLRKRIFVPLMITVLASFTIFPLTQLKAEWGAGKNIFEMAGEFKKNGLGGNLISGYRDSDEMSTTVVLNYLIKGKFFGPFVSDYSTEEIDAGIVRYKIDNYIQFYNSPFEKEQILKSYIAGKADTVMTDIYPGIIVVHFKKGK